jgi:hypothetical protein
MGCRPPKPFEHVISETEGAVSKPPDLVQGTLDLLLLTLVTLF